MGRFVEACKRRGMKVNGVKSKVMVIDSKESKEFT